MKIKKRRKLVSAPLVALCQPRHPLMRYPILLAAEMKSLLRVGKLDCYVVGYNPPPHTEKNVFQFRGNALLLAVLDSLSEKVRSQSFSGSVQKGISTHKFFDWNANGCNAVRKSISKGGCWISREASSTNSLITFLYLDSVANRKISHGHM